MTARSRNGDMLLFKPIVLDARLLLEIAPKASRNDVDFLLVKDPLLSLKRGGLVERAELVLLMRNPIELETVHVMENPLIYL